MTNEETIQQAEPKGEKPWPLIIMLAMVFSVIVAGFLLVPKTEDQKLMWLSLLGTNNYGEFMNPPLDLAGKIFDGEGALWSDDLETPWKLVLVNQGDCDAVCQEMAGFINRVHTRMNKLAPQLKRGYLSVGENSGISVDTALDYEVLQAPSIDMLALLAQSGVPSLSEGPLVFLMNPLSVFFLYYTTEHEGVGMLEDIQHVIKLAQ